MASDGKKQPEKLPEAQNSPPNKTSNAAVLRRERGKFQPEGCLLCCPVPLMSWRADAGYCFVH